MKYLIASDLDGTLLNDNIEISKESFNSINDFVNCGNAFAISTGRSFSAVTQFTDQFNFDIPVICFDGGTIIFSKSKKIILSSSLEDNIGNTIKNDLLDIDAIYVLWINDDLYISKECEETKYYAKKNKSEYKLVNKNMYLKNISKILWIDEPHTNEHRKEFMNKYSNINTVFSTPEYLEILPEEVSKGNALKILEKYLCIEHKNVIAMGDQENDISMIEYAEIGVCPNNATSLVKQNSNYVAKSSNNESLIKEIINKFVNEKE